MSIALVQVLINGLATGAAYSLIGAGLTMTLGVLKVLNIAHGGFFVLAGYLAVLTIFALNIGPLLSLPIVVMSMLALGMATQRLTIEPISDKLDAVIIATYGLAFLIEGLSLFTFGPAFTAVPPVMEGNLAAYGFYINAQRLLAAITALLTMLTLTFLLLRTRIGKAIRAVAEDREIAMVVGIDVTRISMTSFGIGIALVGVASVLLSSIYPVYPAAGWRWLLLALIVVTVGGMGSIKGSFYSGLLYGLVESVLQFFVPQMTLIGLLLVLIIIILIRPSGLFGITLERV